MRRDIAIALLIFTVSALLLFDRLTTGRPIQIFMEGGKVVTIEDEKFFSFYDAVFFVSCAFLAGISGAYIFLKSDYPLEKKAELSSQKKGDVIQTALRMLEGDESKLYKMIIDAGGEMLQKDLILEGGFDKVKVTRLLDKLESKGLLLRIKHGMTNKIVLKRDF